MKRSLNQKGTRAFTLIELLVVIAIIGLLASIVLASLSGARSKGTIGAAQLQESNIFNVIGDAEVLQIDFDLNSGTTVYDTSGYNANGILTNGASLVTTTYNNKGFAASFNAASNQYVRVTIGTTNPQLDISGDVTLSAWIYPTSTSGAQSIVRGGAVADERYGLYYDGTLNRLTFNWYNGSGFPGVNSTSSVVPLNQWSYVVAVRSGSTISFYVNGQYISNGATTAAPVSAGELEIGAAASGLSAPYTGMIDEVRVYNRSITSAAIKQMYLAEAPKYTSAHLADK